MVDDKRKQANNGALIVIGLLVVTIGAFGAFRLGAVHGQTSIPPNVEQLPIPTKLSQLTNDAGFVTSAQTLQANNASFAATTLLAAGTYGPQNLALANAQMGMGVECNLTNIGGNGYNARGIVTSAGTAAITLYVTAPLTLNTVAPNVRCFAY